MKRKAFLATAVALFALGAIGISHADEEPVKGDHSEGHGPGPADEQGTGRSDHNGRKICRRRRVAC